jgi:dihydroneopterin aldolase
MFERFTERARKVMVLAQDEAGRFGHDYIGTEHILLGLVGEGTGVAAQSLSSLGVTLDKAREQVESIVGYGGERTGGQVPFTPRSKKVLELGLRESMQLGHNYIGTEHILLGLAREREGVGVRILDNLDVGPNRVRREVLQRLGEEPEAGPPDEVAAEREAGNVMMFRGRIAALQVEANIGGQQRTMLLDLDYQYEAGDTDEPSEAMDHGGLLEQIADALEGSEYASVEAGILEAGRLVLDRFPMVHEVEISTMSERFSERPTGSGITVSRTFRR